MPFPWADAHGNALSAPPGRKNPAASFTLLQSGAVMLKWKCANPVGSVGTLYEVRRKTGTSAFTLLSTEGTREFTDESLPAGATGVTYEITARRTTVRGMPAQFNVNFGVGSGGGIFITSVTEGGETGMKMAA